MDESEEILFTYMTHLLPLLLSFITYFYFQIIIFLEVTLFLKR